MSDGGRAEHIMAAVALVFTHQTARIIKEQRMLLKGYRLEIFKSKCDANARGVHCFAHLDDDISEVLPYLNNVLGATQYNADPPSLMLKNYGKLITLQARKIAVNALKNRDEAEKIVGWLHREINETWDNRADIEPCFTHEKQPALIEVLKLLPKTNCQKCGEKTCMVFAARVIEGSFDQHDCPDITPVKSESLKEYLSQFRIG